MTSAKPVSVKIPDQILRLMPPARKGRSRFIVAALEEKLSRQKPFHWKPTSERGRRLAALLKKGRRERAPLLDGKGVARELAERRGGLH